MKQSSCIQRAVAPTRQPAQQPPVLPPTEEQLLLAGITTAPRLQQADGDDERAAGRSQVGALQPTPPLRLPPDHASLVKSGPSGTIASKAAAATAAQAVRLHIANPLAGAPAGGLLAALTPGMRQQQQQQQCGSGFSVIHDLVRAAEKTLAAGVGDWHLQALQDISPEFERRVLMGPLGPEALLHTHALHEPQILQLYGLLHRHAAGFQREVATVVQGAQHREQLLAAVWTCFAQLWDECCRVSFEGEVGAAIRELQETYQALLDAQDSLEEVRRENAELKQRGAEFVRTNLDHMLAWRALKAKADALEGEVAMLTAANTEISLRAAGVSARNTQLTVQHEGLQARLATTEHQMQEREAALTCARAALLEKDSGLRQLQGQVAQLEGQVVEGQQGSRQQDDAARSLRAQLDTSAQAVLDAERRVADKQRAFNLLQADFAKQKADAAVATLQAVDLRAELARLQQQLLASQREVVAAHRWQARWEQSQMQVEDLVAAQARATQRRHEIVSSYWPVVNRLNHAEDAVAALSKQVLDLGQEPAVVLPPRDSRARESKGAALADASTGAQEGRPSSSSSSSNQQPHTCGSSQDAGCDASTAGAAAAELPSDSGASLEALLPPDASLAGELQQLRESYLLLQNEYWAQKQQLLNLEVEAGQLRAAAQQAEATAREAQQALSHAQQAAANEAAERSRLEADLVGCRAWIRELERTEQQFLASIRQQGALEDAAAAAQREADDLRSSLAAMASDLRLARVARAAALRECAALLTRLTAELARSNLVEQALQRMHKEEAVASRAARGQLQQVIDQQAAELQVVRAQVAELQQQRNTAVSDQQAAEQQLARAQHVNTQLQQQLSQACAGLHDALQRLQRLETRVSFPGSSSSSSSAASSVLQEHGGSVLLAAEAALHLLDRLLVLLQCLAADASTISMGADVHNAGVLLQALLQGLQQYAAAAAAVQVVPHTLQQQQLVLLRNATGAATKQRCEDLEQCVSALQVQVANADAELARVQAANNRLQRSLNLKTRAVASLERQLGAAEQQLQQARQAVDGANSSMVQLQQELTAARTARTQLAATCTAQTAELAAACRRAGVAEVALQQLQANAAVAGSSAQALTDMLMGDLEAARADAVAAEQARSAAAEAVLHVQQAQEELAAVSAQRAALADEVAACRRQADIARAAARNAHCCTIETTNLLADVRRELEFERCSTKAAAAAAASAVATSPAGCGSGTV